MDDRWSQHIPDRQHPQPLLEQQYELETAHIGVTSGSLQGASFPTYPQNYSQQNHLQYNRSMVSYHNSSYLSDDMYNSGISFPSGSHIVPSPSTSQNTSPPINPVGYQPNISVYQYTTKNVQDSTSGLAHQHNTSIAPNTATTSLDANVNPATASVQQPFVSPAIPLATTFSLPQQLGFTEQANSQLSYFDQNIRDEGGRYASGVKRARGEDIVREGEADPEGGRPWNGSAQERAVGGAKAKQLGACARCKGLKVRCEFKTDPDTCKRCANGNYECVIPGRKKRRAPPKREHLLKQISDQATQIKALMEQLEEANRKGGLSQGSSPVHMSGLDVSSPSLASSDLGSPDPPSVHVTNPDVQNWIAKARESIEAFGGYISMGGPRATVGMFGADAPDSDNTADDNCDDALDSASEEDDDDDLQNDNDYTISAGEIVGSPHQQRMRESSDGPSGGARRIPSSTNMQKLASLPSEAAPFGLMASLSLKRTLSRKHSSRNDADSESDNDVGLANGDYFRPTAPGRPIISDNHQIPYILTNGIVTDKEVEKLFQIYFDYMNLSVSLLDPELYSAQKTYVRSSFLFTVICAIASRYYEPRPDLYPQVMHYAQLAAGTALINAQKSVETVHAYILLSLYPVPARRWEEDRSWLYLGLAIRVATSLNLHHPNTAQPRNEMHGREMLNRTRAWLNCFNLDRSTGSQYGKPPIIEGTDYMANHSEDWWLSSPYNINHFDIHLCCYNADLRLIANFRSRIYSDPSHPTGLNKNIDIAQIASETDDQLASLWEIWHARLRQTDLTVPLNRFRTGLLRLAYSYARLSALSSGFQFAFGNNASGEAPLLWRCLRAAKDVVRAVVDDIGIPEQRIYLRHGPEAQSVFVTFACAFLVKMLQPKYAAYISRSQRVEIREHVQEVVDLLGSPEVGIDDRHGPKLYARFLRGLLDMPMAKIDTPPAPSSSRRASPKSSLRHQRENSFQRSSASPSSSPDPTHRAQSSSITQPVSGPSQPFSTHPAMDIYNIPSQADQLANLNIDFFAPPLPFENEMLQSMHSLTDPSEWLPGFSWLGSYQDSFQPETDYNMFSANMGLANAS